jgi:uncharacterized protein (DUF433 family)
MISGDPVYANVDLALYGDRDPRELPRYTCREAARATNIPPTTIGTWVRGQTYARKRDRGVFRQVIKRPDPHDTRLSFNNLLEVYALRALREYHDVRLDTVRRAIDQAERELDVPRLLISSQLRTSGGDLFLDTYFDLVQLSRGQQYSIRNAFKQYLERIHFEKGPQFFPIPRDPHQRDQLLVLVSPLIAFGKPIIRRLGVSTEAIADRVNAGEAPEGVMEDYGLRDEELAEAIAYESAFPHDSAA